MEVIEGRVGDVLPAADGTPVHGNVLGYGLRDILEQASPGALGQVLFEQMDPLSWRVLVETGPGFSDRIATRLAEAVRHSFGARCQVEVRRIAEIPREPFGKFRYYGRAGRIDS